MVNDPIGDMLIQIKNAGMAGRSSLVLPCSNLKLGVAKILVDEGYLVRAEKKDNGSAQADLHLTLKYDGKESAITGVKRMSKPGLRVYVNSKSIPTVVGGLGMAILSTPSGIMTGRQARKQKIGGELLCTIW